jgi:hypothetical protein
MRCSLSRAGAWLHSFAAALASKRLALIVILSLFAPAESVAETRVVDSAYIEMTGVEYFLWTQGALPPEAFCAPVGNLTMKAPPYLDVPHCLCADTSRFSEQPNEPTEPDGPPQSVLFLAYGDMDGDPFVCPWVLIPDAATTGSETPADAVPPQDPDVVGGCMSVTLNNCHAATAAQCAWKDANDDQGGAPWQWCPPNPPPNTHPCREQYVQGEPFPRFVCN